MGFFMAGFFVFHKIKQSYGWSFSTTSRIANKYIKINIV